MKRICMAVLMVLILNVSICKSRDTCLLDIEFDGEFCDVSFTNAEITPYNVSCEDGALVIGRPGYVSIGKTFYEKLNGLDVITFCTWFYASKPASAADYLFYVPVCDTKAGLEVYMDSIGLRVCGRSCEDDSRFAKKYPLPEFDCWNSISVTWNFKNKTIDCRLNGVLLESDSETNKAAFLKNSFDATAQNGYGLIGHKNKYNTFVGKIDSCRVFDCPLSDAEMSQIMAEKESFGSSEEIEIKRKLESALENSLVLKKNSSFVLNKLCFEKIGYTDKEIMLQIGEHCYLPADYIKKKFGENAAEKNISIFDIEYCDLKDVFSDDLHTYGEFITVGENVALDEKMQQQLLKRFEEKEGYAKMPDGTLIAEENTTGLYLGSPCIVRSSDSVIVVAHDYFGPKNKNAEVIYHSYDDGKTFSQVSQVEAMTWATLFYSGNTLYILGTDKVYGTIVIAKSNDDGVSWSEKSILFDEIDKYHTAPTAILCSGGRIYKAFESARLGTNASELEFLVISAGENSDLMQPSNWIKTNAVSFDKSLLDGVDCLRAGGLEGNMVEDKSGNIYNVLRTTIVPYANKAVRLKLESPSKLSTNSEIIEMPGGSHKFTIRYDARSRKYIAIVNTNETGEFFNKRNTLALAYSDDMINWKTGRNFIYDVSLMPPKKSVCSNGYQYADFQFLGDDIYIVVRQADKPGGNYHDSNKIVFCKYKKYRDEMEENDAVIKIDFDSGDYTFSNNEISICDGFWGNGAYISGSKLNTYVYSNNTEESLNGADAVRVSMSILVDELKTDAVMPLFKCFINDSLGGLIGYIDKNGKMRFEARSSPTDKIAALTADNVFETGIWHRVTFCADFKGKKLQYYVDGVLQKEMEAIQFSKNTYCLDKPQLPDTIFGGFGSSVFNGYIDEIEIIRGIPLKKKEENANYTYEIKNLIGVSDELFLGENILNTKINSKQDGDLYVALYDKSNGNLVDIRGMDVVKNKCQSASTTLELPEDFYKYEYKIFVWNKALSPQN